MSAGPGPREEAGVQKVFICYRREESAAHAGRLYDAMVARFGESNVFMDVDIAPGVDFVERITEVVSGCLVLIVVMGPRWATVTDEDGAPRIADPDDFVRLEVETGLRRSDVTPIPVLVSGARMPKREDLPEPLQPLTRRNALDLSDARWAYDVGRLNSTLDVLLDETPEDRGAGGEPYPTPMPISPPTPVPTPARPAPAPDPPAPARPASAGASSGPGWQLVLEGMAVAGVAGVLGRLIAEGPEIGGSGPWHKIANVMLNRGLTWALVGVALALWLALRTKRTDVLRLGLIGLFVGALAGALGGAIWGARVYLPEPNLEPQSSAANTIQILSLGVTFGLLGTLIGWLWKPPRRGFGLVTGVAAGVLLQLFLNAIGWNPAEQPGNAFSYGVGGVVVTGAVLATLLTLDRQEPRAATIGVGAAEP